MVAFILGAVLLVGAAIIVWGWFEAGWLRTRVVDVEVDGLPLELDGLRVAHLSDFHLGVPGRGRRATEQAVAWVADRRPELVCITGDLLSRRSGGPLLRELLGRLGRTYVVLGNHDLAESRDPFSEHVPFDELRGLGDVEGTTVLGDEAVAVQVRGQVVQLVGVDPSTYACHTAQPQELADPAASFRILLCHFPEIARRVPAGSFDLVLAGHLHAGQIVVPYPGGRLRLAHLRARDVEGLYRYRTTVLHVSPGLGTTFVPFRLFARPEVTELVLVRPSSL